MTDGIREGDMKSGNELFSFTSYRFVKRGKVLVGALLTDPSRLSPVFPSERRPFSTAM